MVDLIILNVGGKEFMCDRITFNGTCVEKNKFWKPYAMRDGIPIYFFDRSPVYFGVILDYLRTRKMIIGNLDEHLVWSEFDFWGLEIPRPLDTSPQEWDNVKLFVMQLCTNIMEFIHSLDNPHKMKEFPNCIVIPPLSFSEKLYSFLLDTSDNILQISDPVLRDIYVSLISETDFDTEVEMDTSYVITKELREKANQAIEKIITNIMMCNTQYFLTLMRYHFCVHHQVDMRVYKQERFGDFLIENEINGEINYELFLPDAWWHHEFYICPDCDPVFEFYKTQDLLLIKLSRIGCLPEVTINPLPSISKKHASFHLEETEDD